MKRTFFQAVQIWFIELVAKIHWRQKSKLSEEHKQALREKLTHDYYIIATRRDNQLTTFFICLGHFLLTGNWGRYSHVLMNLEDEVKSDDDFRLIEATGKGVHFSTFEQVFEPTYDIALIVPNNMSLEDWTLAFDKAKTFLGRPYDNLFNLKNDLEINCVELIRLALADIPDYNKKFANFEKLVRAKKKITPDMFIDCPDFKVVYKIKR
jgi:hypothetical protein